MDGAWNVHFSGLKYRLGSCGHLKTVHKCLFMFLQCCGCCNSYIVCVLHMMVPCICHFSMTLQKMVFIKAWKVAGELQSKEHDQWFPESIFCFEHHFVSISFLYTDVVISISDI
jgi:hypothetical protein